MPKINVARKFTLTLDDGTVKAFAVGLHSVPDEVAAHWYVRAHLLDEPEAEPAPGSPEDAAKQAAAQAEADAKAKAEADAKAQADAEAQAKAEADLKAKTAEAISKQAENAAAQADADAKSKKG
ncbi:STY1053 family phage-associated protein [Labrys neptuniae]